MRNLLFLLLPLALISQEMPQKKESFLYVGVGGTVLSINPEYLNVWTSYITELPVAADFTFGRRQRFGNHGWDLLLGGFVIHGLYFPWPYAQSSYLYYPQDLKGVYFGAGVTLLPSPGYIFPNVPLTIGYQTKNPKSPKFIQLQFAALTQSVTLSYGIGF